MCFFLKNIVDFRFLMHVKETQRKFTGRQKGHGPSCFLTHACSTQCIGII